MIEMWVGGNTPNCGAGIDTDWVPITDPDFVDITEFIIDDNASFEGSITDEDETITQRTRNIQVQLQGTLIRDDTITRRIEDVIKVRNDLITSEPII